MDQVGALSAKDGKIVFAAIVFDLDEYLLLKKNQKVIYIIHRYDPYDMRVE